MKIKWALSFVTTMVVMGVMMPSAVHAASLNNRRVVLGVEIKACNDHETDLRSVAPGFKCRTSKGWLFERVAKSSFGEAWKGPDGWIWSDEVGNYSQKDAVSTCKALGGILPSISDFERGEIYGFREVLPNMNNPVYWSSTIGPFVDNLNGYLFDSYAAYTYYDYRYYVHAVRCVVR
ncbi:hypothetical protein WDW37_11545 [Bdellovibrionota bacterium FG-1]